MSRKTIPDNFESQSRINAEAGAYGVQQGLLQVKLLENLKEI